MSGPDESVKLAKANDPRYIFNPKTRRWVLRNTPTGKSVANRMTRRELVDHINHHASSEMLKYRDLLRSDMSDDALS